MIHIPHVLATVVVSPCHYGREEKEDICLQQREASQAEEELAMREGLPWMDLRPSAKVTPETEHSPGCHDHVEAMVHVINTFHSHQFAELLEACGELEPSQSPGPAEQKFWRGIRDDYVNDDDDLGQTALHWAAKHGRTEAVRLLLNKGHAQVDAVNDAGETPLVKASENGHIAVVEMLLDIGGANINVKDSIGNIAALNGAILKGDNAMVHFLISRGIDVNAADESGGTPLLLAALEGHLESVVNLIEAGAAIDAAVSNGYTSLSFAVEYGHEEIVKILLDKGAMVNVAAGDENLTPLMISAQRGYLGIAQLLVDHNADVDAVNSEGDTALHLAAYEGHLGIVQLLAGYKGAFDKQDSNGITPMRAAVIRAKLEVVQFLLDLGADPNVPTKSDMMTAVIEATIQGYLHIVEALVKAGADVNHINNEGQSALSWARNLAIMSNNRRKLLEVIENSLVDKGLQAMENLQVVEGGPTVTGVEPPALISGQSGDPH